MKLFVKITVSLLISVLVVALIATGIYWFNWNNNAKIEATEVNLESTELTLGKPTPLQIQIQTPWYRSVEDTIFLKSNEFASLSEDIKVTRSGFNLSGFEWTVESSLIAFEEGNHKDLSVIVSLSSDREKKQKDLEVSLPEIKVSLSGFNKVSDVALKDKLNAADLLKPENSENSQNYYWLWPAAAGLILTICALIYMSLKKNNVRVLSPWEKARIALAELKKELSINDETFFVRLSDILRQYIERRFALPATEKTSEEFIQQLRTDSILSEKQRIALERFLGTADLVKFAKMNSDEKQKNDCLSMAYNFVDETIPQPMEGAK